MEPTRQPEATFDEICDVVRQRLALNQRIRRNIPGGGRLRIDRQLPFLCVYRQPADRDDPGTRDLVTTEAAYLVAPGGEEYQEGLRRLCRTIGETLQQHFGVLLLLELWAEEDQPTPASDGVRRPAFELVASEADLPSTVEAFQQALERIRIDGRSAEVRVDTRERLSPAGMPPLTEAWLGAARHAPGDAATCREGGPSSSQARNQAQAGDPRTSPHGRGGDSSGQQRDQETTAAAPDAAYDSYCASCFYLGLVVRPIYRDPQTGVVFPVILQQLQRQMSKALRRAIFAFTGIQSADPKLHFESLGPSAMVKDSRLVDLELAEVSESFDLILQATPINVEPEWQKFRACGYRQSPRLKYRPLPYHPGLLKRRLYEVPMEKVEDPTLAYLFSQKQVELDREISALRDLDTPHFLPLSIQIYGKPSQSLLELARQIMALDHSTAASCEEDDEEHGECIHAMHMVERVREEFDHYHGRMPSFTPRVEVCNDIASNLLVSRDRLFVAETFQTSAARVEPLLHHEVGTHLLTYFNGREQVLRQLYAGLAGYEGLQEGLAMLAEYCSGGLTLRRLRTIAGRTLAIGAMIDGHSFVDVFHLLRDAYGFGDRAAYMCTIRAFRGGGFTKDIIYLRGLHELLEFLAKGNELEPLFVGKIALEHVPFIQELRRRGIVKAPALLPRYWEREDFRARLAECRNSTVIDLVTQPGRQERKAS